MTVFVVQQPMPNNRGWMPDLSSAAQHGPIEYVFSGGEKVYALPGPSIHKARHKLKNFNCEKDHILWPGSVDPMALIISVMAIMEQGPPDKISVLYWDRMRDRQGRRSEDQGFYVPIGIERVSQRMNDERQF